MIISRTRIPTLEDFQELVARSTEILNTEAKQKSEYFLTRNAQKLENDVFSAMVQAAIGSPFEGTIEKISGQHFPDIVAAKFFGVEVKSSKDANWTTLGGSVNESTRPSDVAHIFLIFGKLVAPVEFRSRPYQECLSEVVVTHYPRYKIDMNLGTGETIFDKMHTDYDTLRHSENPVAAIIRYYKSKLKNGERLWWLDDGGDKDKGGASNLPVVRLWKTLSCEEQQDLIVSAYAFFPEIVGYKQDKYNNLSLWLVANYGVVSSNLRDYFSGGGQQTLLIDGESIKVSKTIFNMYSNLADIKIKLKSVTEDFLKDVWNVTEISKDRFGQWVDLVVSHNPKCGAIFAS